MLGIGSYLQIRNEPLSNYMLPASKQPPSDEELLTACRDGDTDAWPRLVRRYEALVFSVPLRYRLSRVEAEDVVQNTFVALMDNLPTLRSDSNLGAWLCTVARRYTWRLLRQNAREFLPEPDGDLDWIQLAQSLGASDSDAFDFWEAAELLNRGLARLPERCREILIALYFDPDEPSYADIAARWGISVGSVGPTRARCLERLKQLLTDS
jgi:RNA polymerase sigma factor (sigma-70 family)